MLSISGKNRLLRQSLDAINRLTVRLTTCPLESFNHVSDLLRQEKEAYATLMNEPTKPSRRLSKAVR